MYLSILTVINIDTIDYLNMYLNLYNGKTRSSDSLYGVSKVF